METETTKQSYELRTTDPFPLPSARSVPTHPAKRWHRCIIVIMIIIIMIIIVFTNFILLFFFFTVIAVQ
jgi:hypothetical protein